MKGNTYGLGYTHTEEEKALMHKNHADYKEEKHPQWNGGKKVVQRRKNAKRKRQLGYTLLMPLVDGEVGHHVTDEYVIGIPSEIHTTLGGGGRKNHRTKVLQWLKANNKKKYLKVLCVLAKEP
jgi:hypothetical protein